MNLKDGKGLVTIITANFSYVKSCISELEAKLQFERERREELEADMDQMRKQLQHTQSQLHKYQAISSPHHSQVHS